MADDRPTYGLSELSEAILTAAPWFRESWIAFCADWAQPDAPGAHVMGDQLIAALERLSPTAMPDLSHLASTIERFLVEGDKETRDAVAIGILEPVHSSIDEVPILESALVPLLGSRSRLVWDNILRNNGYFRSDQFSPGTARSTM